MLDAVVNGFGPVDLATASCFADWSLTPVAAVEKVSTDGPLGAEG